MSYIKTLSLRTCRKRLLSRNESSISFSSASAFNCRILAALSLHKADVRLYFSIKVQNEELYGILEFAFRDSDLQLADALS